MPVSHWSQCPTKVHTGSWTRNLGSIKKWLPARFSRLAIIREVSLGSTVGLARSKLMKTAPSRINILLVDDNESNLLALETILRGEDRHLIRAASGEEALQYLLHNEAAVILMDVRMPGINGLETAELIRGRKKSRDVPIIFLTAYDSPDNAESLRGYSLGAVDYLIKPVDPDALKSKVAVFVELHKKTEV